MWIVLALLCCAAAPPPAPVPQPAPAQAAPPEPEPVAPPVHIRLVAAGDVLPHRAVKATAAASGWDLVFRDITPQVQAAHLAFANLESPVAPVAHQGIHGEVFNAPTTLLDGLAATGFDVLSMANNHAYDQGPAGVLETFANVRARGMVPVGAGPTCAAATTATFVERRGIRVAFLAAADLSNIDDNGAADQPCVFFAGSVCTGADCGPDRDAIHFRPDVDRLAEAVKEARSSADFVVVSFHWGDEYRTAPLPEYPPLAQALLDAGADVILGHHPHVLQPIEVRPTADGRQGVVAYSLGNLVSNMAADYDPSTSTIGRGNTRDGVLLGMTLVKHPDGSTAITDVAATPLWTLNNHNTRGDGPHEVRVTTHAALRTDPSTHELLEVRGDALRAILDPDLLSAD